MLRRRGVLAAAIASLALAGCAIVDKYSDRAVEYNLQAEKTQQQNLLLNIIRASLRRPMQFTGLTSITGLDWGRNGSLYVVEIVKDGVFNLFSGGDTTGALIKIRHGHQTELVAGRLHAPGDVAVAHNGTVYVTNQSVSPDSGEVLAIR